MKKLFGILTFLFLTLLAVPAYPATFTAASCSIADIQTQITAIGATTGQTLAIPAGTCNWTSQLSWAVPSGTVIKGAGSTSIRGGNDTTIIVDNYADAHSMLSLTGITGNVEIYGLTFQKGNGTLKDQPAMVYLSGTSTTLKLHHFHVNNDTGSADNGNGMLMSCVTGVVYEYVVTLHAEGTGNGIKVSGCDEGDASWAAATGFGSGSPSTYLYFEDGTFETDVAGGTEDHGTATDCDHGGRYVWRFNLMEGSSVQTHPTGGSGVSARGCRATEVYANSFSGSTSTQNFNDHFLSSGTSLNWGNNAPVGAKNYITLHSMRRNADTYGESATPTGWGYCGTSFNGTGSNWDENSSASTGRRCLDQPGNGIGDLLTGTPPTKVNNRTGTIAWPEQTLEPFYTFMNIYGCSGCDQAVYISVYETDVLVENVEWYRPVGATNNGGSIQTNATTPFNGTAGTGWGTLANRPTTCTTGVAYAVTDAVSGLGTANWNDGTNALYTGDMALQKCTSTNTWTTYYTPYTYPHPLRGAVVVDSTGGTRSQMRR